MTFFDVIQSILAAITTTFNSVAAEISGLKTRTTDLETNQTSFGNSIADHETRIAAVEAVVGTGGGAEQAVDVSVIAAGINTQQVSIDAFVAATLGSVNKTVHNGSNIIRNMEGSCMVDYTDASGNPVTVTVGQFDSLRFDYDAAANTFSNVSVLDVAGLAEFVGDANGIVVPDWNTAFLAAVGA